MACSIGDTIINGTGTSHRTWYTFVVSTALRTLYELIRYVGAPPRPTKFPTLACTHAARETTRVGQDGRGRERGARVDYLSGRPAERSEWSRRLSPLRSIELRLR